ncbi:MAG: Uma2 family endonuclease [Waterburya sp.]
MLINIQLPINAEILQGQDQTLSLAGMSWAEYEKFDSEEYLGYRVSYFNGVITIVSPSKNHERIAATIAIIVIAYCRKLNLLYFPMRSTRLSNKPNVGKEPDVSFAFGTDKELPDLAIEVIFSSGRIDDLKKYQSIGIKEVWFWQDHKIVFYQLNPNGYKEISTSISLPNLAADTLESFVNRGFTESPLTIESDFIKQIENN